MYTQQKRARSREAALRAQGGRECDELKGRVDRAHLGVQVLDLLALLVHKYKYCRRSCSMKNVHVAPNTRRTSDLRALLVHTYNY